MPDVVLPVLDEVEAIASVLAAMPYGFVPIVVDNGSSDGSGELARSLGARVVYEPRRGYGAACHAGLEAARAEVVCMMDCDGSLDPAELVAVAGPVTSGGADLVVGRRVAVGRSWPRHARLANRLLAAEVGRRTGVRISDIGPMRAARREDLLSLGIGDRRFGYPLETILRSARSGWRIREVPVRYRGRAGRSKVTGTVRGTARAVRDMALVLR